MKKRIKLKRTLLYIVGAVVLYLAVGALLLNYEQIQRLYIFPGWSIKHGETDEDSSTVSADGPIILYEKHEILRFQVSPAGDSLSALMDTIGRKDTLTCFVDETKDTFKFILRDSLPTEPSEFPLPEKMLVLSDIEGNFKGLKMILQGNRIVDKNFNWNFGDNHLVLVGDFFDRGVNVTECLWLIYKLEAEAEKQGGKVHFILGNHEMMNLKGHLKYIRDKYEDNSDTLKLAYEKWYSQNSELGRWLRTKNGVEKIGKYLFVHGGISKDFPKNYSLEQINKGIRQAIDQHLTDEQHRDNVFIGNNSPLWYRGVSTEEESQQDLNQTLSRFKVDKMIVGHTLMDKISYLYDQKVVAIDLEHQANTDKGEMFALLIEGGKFYTVDQSGRKAELK